MTCITYVTAVYGAGKQSKEDTWLYQGKEVGSPMGQRGKGPAEVGSLCGIERERASRTELKPRTYLRWEANRKPSAIGSCPQGDGVLVNL